MSSRPNKRKLILHVGTYKTATTSLQEMLAQNRAWLASRGVLYPRMKLGVGRYSINHRLWVQRLMGRPGSARHEASVPYFNETVVAQARAHPGATVLLSAEGFSDIPPSRDAMQRAETMRRALVDFDVSVLLYVRRQDQWYESMHNQRVKTSGDTRELEAFVADGLDRGLADYAAQYRFWRDSLGVDVEVRIFEKSQLLGGDVVEDFLRAVGVADRDGLTVVRPKNPRLHPRLLAPKRALNRHLKSSVARQAAKRVSLLVQRLLPAETRHTMSRQMASDILEHHAAGNAFIATEALGRAAGGLFDADPNREPWDVFVP